jgi:PTS system mannitol-specific IIC component
VDNSVKVQTSLQDSFDAGDSNLFKLVQNVFLAVQPATKKKLSRLKQLVKGGYVQPEYVEGDAGTRKLTPTYLVSPSPYRTAPLKRKIAC